jgi:predicted MFS family arabinose efflux permease
VGELFFVEDVLGRGEVAYGLMLSVWTVGMALGAMLVSRRVAAGATATGALTAVAIQGAALALPAAFLGFGLFLACMLIGGLAHGVKNVMFRTLIHSRVPDSLHGRAFAAYNGIRNTAELAAFTAGGLLIAGIGARETVAYAGGLAAIVGLAGLLAMLRVFRGWQPTGPIGRAEPAAARAAP